MNKLEKIFDALERGVEPHNAVYDAFRHYFPDMCPMDAADRANALSPEFVRVWQEAKGAKR